jgi:uncharacterized membrane protein YphA (DoxX/SURF4 family)
VLIALTVRLILGYAAITLAHYHLTRGRVPFTHDLKKHFGHYAPYLVVFGGAIEIIIAVLLVIGLCTQIAALLSAALYIKILFLSKHYPHFGFESKRYYWVLCILSFALALAGSGGYFSFDYPL